MDLLDTFSCKKINKKKYLSDKKFASHKHEQLQMPTVIKEIKNC